MNTGKTESPSSEQEKPKIFISSAWSGLKDIRADLYEWANVQGYEAWLFEKAREEAEWRKLKAPETEKLCLDEVSRADLYIGIFHKVYGSSAQQHFGTISFVDAEFFEAFKSGVPMRLFILEPFDPQEELQQLLQIVRSLRPNSIIVCATEQALKERIKWDIDRHFRRSSFLSLPRNPYNYLKRYFTSVVLSRKIHDDEETGLRFLLDRYPSTSVRLDPDLVRSQIQEVKRFKSYDAQLNGCWNTLQGLFNVPWWRNHDHLKLWDEVLGVWDTAAAWYGLHGFGYIGKLAGDNTLLAVRALLASHGETASIKQLLESGSKKTGTTEEWIHLYGLGGALASEYYSIAKTVLVPSLKKRYLEKADSWIRVAERTYKMENNPGRQAGLSTIRGYIMVDLSRTDEAVKLFDQSLKLRKDGGWSLASIAEAKADLGYAHMLVGRKREAEALLLEGVHDLEAYGSPGFVVRAKKKLASFYFRQRAFRRGLQQLVEAKTICEKHNIKDQLSELRFLCRIPKKLLHWLGIRQI